MRYFWAIVLPPVAVLMCGKPFQFLLNIVLTCCFVIPGMLHALMVVSQFNGDQRHREMLMALGGNRASKAKATSPSFGLGLVLLCVVGLCGLLVLRAILSTPATESRTRTAAIPDRK